MNGDLLSKSGKLRQYAEFIAKVRDFYKLYDDYSKAVRDATNYCIDNDILTEFLREHGGEIVSILATEYNEEVAKRIWREEAAEDKAVEIARNALRKKMSVVDIIDITGLDEYTIKQLQAEIITS